MGLGTPLSMPHSEGSLHAGQVTTGSMQDFNPQALAPQVFQNPNPFAFHHHQQHHDLHQQQHPHPHTDHQNFPHPHFTHQPVSFGSFQTHPHHEEQKMDDYSVDVDMHEQSPIGGYPQQSLGMTLRQEQPLLPMEKYVFSPTVGDTTMVTRPDQLNSFRYHLTLNAPTAMIKHPEEIPVTYLNKGQAYALSIVDTKPAQIGESHRDIEPTCESPLKTSSNVYVPLSAGSCGKKDEASTKHIIAEVGCKPWSLLILPKPVVWITRIDHG